MKRSKFTEAQIALILRQEEEGQRLARSARQDLGGDVLRLAQESTPGWCRIRNKTPKRVKAKLREGRQVATRSKETWAMDFVHNQLVTGRKLRVLTIVDTFRALCVGD